MTVVEVPQPEQIPLKPILPGDGLRLGSTTDTQAAAAEGEPTGAVLFDLDASETDSIDTTTEIGSATEHDAPQSGRETSGGQVQESGPRSEPQAAKRAAQPIGQLAADIQLDKSIDPKQTRECEVPRAQDTGRIPDEPQDEEDDMADKAPSPEDDPAEPSGADGGKGGPIDGSSLRSDDGGDRPWRRNRADLDAETQATVEELERQGTALEVSLDSVVIGYPSPEEGTLGFIAGRIDTAEHPDAVIGYLGMSENLRGLGLEVPLVADFAATAERQGAETVGGRVDLPEVLDTLYEVFGEGVEFVDPDVMTNGAPTVLPMTVSQAFASLDTERVAGIRVDEGIQALTEGRPERVISADLYFQAPLADRRIAGRVPPAPVEEGEATQLPLAVIDLREIEDNPHGVGLQIAEAIQRGEDVDTTLNAIAHDYAERGHMVANAVQDYLGMSGLSSLDTSLDTLYWVKANLAGNAETRGNTDVVDMAILGREDDDIHAWRMVDTAANWAEAGNRTADRVNEICIAMVELKSGFTPANLPLQDILADYQQPESTTLAQEYGALPLVAKNVAYILDTPDSPKVARLNNSYSAQEYGEDRLEVIGSAPLGILIHHQGVPQYVLGFDVAGSTVTIHDIEPVNSYLRISPTEETERVTQIPQYANDFDIPAAALAIVPLVCAELGLLENPYDATLRVISAMNNSAIPPGAASLSQAMYRYDRAAGARGMRLDERNNWVAPVSHFIEPDPDE